jgi:hypothetical protein
VRQSSKPAWFGGIDPNNKESRYRKKQTNPGKRAVSDRTEPPFLARGVERVFLNSHVDLPAESTLIFFAIKVQQRRKEGAVF